MAAKRASRRKFIKEGAVFAGGLAGGMAIGANSASGQGLGAPRPGGVVGHPMAYGERSRFVQTVRTPMTMIGHIDLHGNPDGLDARTPLSELTGTITPSALHYVSSHGNNPPDIDPREHRLTVYGLVDRPLVFTMEELTRLPSVTRVHFIECIANSPRPEEKTLDEMHGMVACSEWTGVPAVGAARRRSASRTARAGCCRKAPRRPSSGPACRWARPWTTCWSPYAQERRADSPPPGVPAAPGGARLPGQVPRQVAAAHQGDRPSLHHLLGETSRPRRARAPGGPAPNRMSNSHVAGAGAYFMEQGPKSVITFPSGEQAAARARLLHADRSGLVRAAARCGAWRCRPTADAPGPTRSCRSRCSGSR